jgi:hypothetical protein
MPAHMPVTPILVEDFAVLLRTLGGGNKVAHDHLEAMASLKRLENAVKKASTELTPYANAEFKGREGTIPLEGGASIKKYTKPGKWIFPDNIQQREHELNVLKDEAKASGTARQEEADIDPAKDRTFSVSAPVRVTQEDMPELLDAAKTLSKPKAGSTPPFA